MNLFKRMSWLQRIHVGGGGRWGKEIVEDTDMQVWGEVYETSDAASVLGVLDEIEGYRPDEPARSLYTRVWVDVALEGGAVQPAWAYFYNAPLGRAPRIASGNYLEHLNGH